MTKYDEFKRAFEKAEPILASRGWECDVRYSSFWKPREGSPPVGQGVYTRDYDSVNIGFVPKRRKAAVQYGMWHKEKGTGWTYTKEFPDFEITLKELAEGRF